jgi:hypothetical protein
MGHLNAGAAKVDITPELGHNLAGWIDVRPATRQASTILAHAIALVAEEAKAIIITCDLVGMGKDLRKRIEKAIRKLCDVPSQHVFILPSHNHYGPSVSGSYADDSERTGQEMVYTERLIDKFATVARTALDACKPARLRISYGEERNYCRNSRFWRKDGTINWVGNRDKNFARESGPYDPQIAVLHVADEQDNTIATLYNLACHANAAEEDGFTAISWDWPGYATQTIESSLGGEALFLVGACGNVHPIQEGIVKDMGEEIGSIAVNSVKKGQAILPIRLQILHQEIVIPARDFSSFDPRQIELICSQLWDEETRIKVQSIFMRVLDDLKNKKLPDHIRLLRALILGDLAILFLPGEFFTEFGLEIKKHSPFAHTFVVQSLSESLGYIPTLKAYDEGGYQPGVGTRIAPGGGEMVVKTALTFLKEIKP